MIIFKIYPIFDTMHEILNACLAKITGNVVFICIGLLGKSNRKLLKHV